MVWACCPAGIGRIFDRAGGQASDRRSGQPLPTPTLRARRLRGVAPSAPRLPQLAQQVDGGFGDDGAARVDGDGAVGVELVEVVGRDDADDDDEDVLATQPLGLAATRLD